MNKSVRYQFIFGIVLVSSIITLVITGLQIYSEHQQELGIVEDTLEQIETSYLESLSEGVWHYDEEQTRLLAKGIWSLPRVDRVLIRVDREVFFELGDVDNYRRQTQTYPLIQTYRNEQMQLGELEVVIGLDSIYTRLKKRVFFSLVGNGFKTFLVSGLALFLFNSLIGRRLRDLKEGLDRSMTGELGMSFPIANRERGDEIDVITQAFWDYHQRIKGHIRELKESQQRYEVLIENIPLKIFQKDINSRYINANKQFFDSVKMKAEDVIGKMDFDFFPTDLASRYRNDDRVVLEQARVVQLREKYVDAEGKWHEVQTIKAPVRDSEGQITGLIGIFHDTSELRQTQLELERTEHKFQSFLRLVDKTYLFYELDSDDHLTYLDARAESVFGPASEENNPLKKALLEEDLVQQRKEKRKLAFELSLPNREGQKRTFDIVEFVEDDAVESSRYSLGVARDITDQKKMERQLAQSEKMKAMGTLTGGIAHDFNNILAIILGNTDIALRVHGRELEREYQSLTKIQTAALRAQELVKQIMQYSRPEDEKTRHYVNPVQVIEEVVRLLEVNLAKNIQIQTDLKSDVGPIPISATELFQVIMNLCTNALHALEKQGGLLTLSLSRSEFANKGPGVLIVVEDNGVGIDQHDLDKIFDPYFTTKEVGKGSGLGLSIVHGIVTHARGTIKVEGQKGIGTRFQLYFPIEEGLMTDSHQEEELRGGDEHILVVDDEAMLTDLVKEMLGELGYQVTCAYSGSEALELLSQDHHGIDLVLTDQVMPGLPGHELAKKILEQNSQLPVVLYTGFSQSISEKEALALGIRAFVPKPVRRAALAKLIRQVLDQKKIS